MSESALIASNITRPEPGEYASFYERYIALVPGTDLIATFESQRREMLILLCSRDDKDGDFRYAPDKWSLKEVLAHVCDAERIFTYRAMRISRGDRTPLPGFEQDDYVRNNPFSHRPIADLIEDYIAVRRATISLYRNLDEEAWTRRGIANNAEVSVRAIAYLTAGHEVHHRRILQEKYLPV